MEEIKEAKRRIREDMQRMIASLSEKDLAEKTRRIEDRLFEFANFQEARIPLMHIGEKGMLDTWSILRRCRQMRKMVILPVFGKEKFKCSLLKVDDLKRDMKTDADGRMFPNPERCKPVPMECIEIALIPAVALDEKGGRVGAGYGHYDRLIPRLPMTTRKVCLALEGQILGQAPATSNDKTVDIIITEERVIYKI